MVKQKTANDEANRERSRGKKQLSHEVDGVNGEKRNGLPVLGNKMFGTPGSVVNTLQFSLSLTSSPKHSPLLPKFLPH